MADEKANWAAEIEAAADALGESIEAVALKDKALTWKEARPLLDVDYVRDCGASEDIPPFYAFTPSWVLFAATMMTCPASAPYQGRPLLQPFRCWAGAIPWTREASELGWPSHLSWPRRRRKSATVRSLAHRRVDHRFVDRRDQSVLVRFVRVVPDRLETRCAGDEHARRWNSDRLEGLPRLAVEAWLFLRRSSDAPSRSRLASNPDRRGHGQEAADPRPSIGYREQQSPSSREAGTGGRRSRCQTSSGHDLCLS